MTLQLVSMGLWDSFSQMLGTMMQPLYWAVSWILVVAHKAVSTFLDPTSGWSWALAIVMLTMVIRTLLIPLFVRQINSSRKMQLLGPKMKELQEKYGQDRERLGQETMKLYKEEGVNPMASCLPLFLQMPIFIALYQVLSDGSRNVAQGVFKNDPQLLESLSNARFAGAGISSKFWPLTAGWGAQQTVTAFLIIGMTVTLFITQLQLMRKNMPPSQNTPQMEQQQKMMLYVFPAMYLFMGISIPVGVLVYWFTSNVWTLGQQWLLIRNNPTPNTPAFIEWEERLLAKGKDPKQELERRASKGRRTPRAATSSRTPEASSRTETAKPTVQRQQIQPQATSQRNQPRSRSRATRKQN